MEYSVIGLYRKLTNLIIHDVGAEVEQKPLVDHKECNPGPYIMQQVKAAIDEIPSPLEEHHKVHLEEREELLRR